METHDRRILQKFYPREKLCSLWVYVYTWQEEQSRCSLFDSCMNNRNFRLQFKFVCTKRLSHKSSWLSFQMLCRNMFSVHLIFFMIQCIWNQIRSVASCSVIYKRVGKQHRPVRKLQNYSQMYSKLISSTKSSHFHMAFCADTTTVATTTAINAINLTITFLLALAHFERYQTWFGVCTICAMSVNIMKTRAKHDGRMNILWMT